MNQKQKNKLKRQFLKQLQDFAKGLSRYVSTKDNQWVIKGFIDVFEKIYTITSDTKIVSKVIEIHLFPKFLEFAKKYKYKMIFAEQQNWYPDITFVSIKNENIKFAVDLKTTYIKENNPDECNGFTLGSHGEYFRNRQSSKNIQFPYEQYIGHYCLGILYTRNNFSTIHDTKIYKVKKLNSIPSVIKDFIFFAQEKWRIASDKSGSGNTANIGSIKKIDDLLKGNGIFWKLFKEEGEQWFDDYWINYGQIISPKTKKKITSLKNFLEYKGINIQKLNKGGKK